MRAPAAAGLGANAESFIHDLANGAGTTAARGATSEAPIDLPCRPGRLLCVGNDTANIVVAQHIAGTDDHQHQHSGKRGSSSICHPPCPDAKAKRPDSSYSKLAVPSSEVPPRPHRS